jgi:hypothetical protein
VRWLLDHDPLSSMGQAFIGMENQDLFLIRHQRFFTILRVTLKVACLF